MQRLDFVSPEEAKRQRAEANEANHKSLCKKRGIKDGIYNHIERKELESEFKEVWD